MTLGIDRVGQLYPSCKDVVRRLVVVRHSSRLRDDVQTLVEDRDVPHEHAVPVGLQELGYHFLAILALFSDEVDDILEVPVEVVHTLTQRTSIRFR